MNVGATLLTTADFKIDKQDLKIDEKAWRQLSDRKSIYHQQGHYNGVSNKSNMKFVSVDGHNEVVLDRNLNLVTDPVNQGTYNFAGPQVLGGVPHFVLDVIPYYVLGNSIHDPTTVIDRVSASYSGNTAPFYDNASSALP